MDLYLGTTNWAWGMLLIAATTTLHATGVVMMARVMIALRGRLAKRNLGARHLVMDLIGVVALVGIMLTILHGTEATVWAVAYLWLGALDTPFDALLFSLGSMTTAGAPGLALARHWQMMNLMESLNGVLLFGISTAYVFAVMQDYWLLARERH